MASTPDLSIILPCYNAESFLFGSLEALTTTLQALPITWEIIVVDDGSTDNTAALLAAWEGPNFRWIRFESNRGKGAAVRAGMQAAEGRQRIFTDVDLPYELEVIARCYSQLEAGSWAVFGSRRLSESSQVGSQSMLRRVGSRVFAAVARLVIGRGDLDTQCGFKGFNGLLASELFPRLRIDGFAFDVEASYLLTAAGVNIVNIPVQLVNHTFSTVTVLGGGVQSFIDVARIGLRRLYSAYPVEQLRLFVGTTLQHLPTQPQG